MKPFALDCRNRDPHRGAQLLTAYFGWVEWKA
jgi:hypothetical protein